MDLNVSLERHFIPFDRVSFFLMSPARSISGTLHNISRSAIDLVVGGIQSSDLIVRKRFLNEEGGCTEGMTLLPWNESAGHCTTSLVRM